MPWSYDDEVDHCQYCEEYGQDCGAHGMLDDAAETLKSLALDDPWIKSRKPNPKYL